VNATTVSFIVVGCLISVGIGLVRGRTVHLGERDGVLWMRYTVGTLLLWVLNLAAKVAVWPFEHAVSPSATSAANHGLLLSVGWASWRVAGGALPRDAHEATVVWAKGRTGVRPDAAGVRTGADLGAVRFGARSVDQARLVACGSTAGRGSVDGVLRWLQRDTNLRQVFIAVAVLAACWIAVHPRGTSGTGLAVVCLLVACSLLLLVRMLPLPPWALNAYSW